MRAPPPETAVRSYPVPKPLVKEPPITAKQGRGTGAPTQPAGTRRPPQHAHRPDGTNRCDGICTVRPPPGLEQPAVWNFHSAWRAWSSSEGTAAYDRARDFVGGSTLPLIAGPPSAKAKSTVLPKLSEPAPANRQDLSTTLNRIATALEKDRGKSSFEAGYGTNVYAAQSEEEYTGMIAEQLWQRSQPGRSSTPGEGEKTGEMHPPSSSRHTSPS